MSDRRERIPAEEVPDPKRWKLPFWTEPKHIIHAEEELEAEDDSEVVVEDEEIEIEPLTADQLESIRQEAYNEGLEQGLIEGRQKGEKLGFEEGQKEGLIQGKEEGNQQGYKEGLAKGEKVALNEGESKSAGLASQIQSNMRHLEKSISDQTSAIEKILPELVIALAQAVISEELDQGSEHIVNLVQQVLSALPTDSKGLTIECNSLDLPFLEAAQEHTDFEAKFKANSTIQPGGCKVTSQHSSIDFTQSERWHSVLKQYHQQLQLGLSKLDDIQQGFIDETDSVEHTADAEHTSEKNEAADEPSDLGSQQTSPPESIQNKEIPATQIEEYSEEKHDQSPSESADNETAPDQMTHAEPNPEEAPQSDQQAVIDSTDTASQDMETETDSSIEQEQSHDSTSDMNPPETGDDHE